MRPFCKSNGKLAVGIVMSSSCVLMNQRGQHESPLTVRLMMGLDAWDREVTR